jgi:hypothetical protein
MLIAGLRHLDRVRGTGWLDCPNCHEHAAQDVIDDMTFVEALGYRFSPVGRKRLLLCRRCGHRRPATAEEMQHLETGGGRIHRAVMAPLGVLGVAFFGLIVALIYLVSKSEANALANQHIEFVKQNAQVFPATFEGPSSWNYDPEKDVEPFYIKVSDSGGRMYFVIKRVIDSRSLEDILKNHFDDEVGIRTQGFPEKPPDAKKTTVAGFNAITVRIHYTEGAENDEQNIFCFAHNGVGYVVTYVALGDEAITTMRDVADKVNGSIQFTATETPPPLPSESPSPSASGSPSASSSPTP